MARKIEFNAKTAMSAGFAFGPYCMPICSPLGQFGYFSDNLLVSLQPALSIFFGQLINIETMKFFNDCENQPVNNQIWTKFAEDSDHENNFEQGIETHEGSLISDPPSTIVNFPIEDYLSQEISGTKQNMPPFRNLEIQQFGTVFFRVRQICQDRNTLKFLVRLFLKYHGEYIIKNQDSARVQDTENAFKKHCKDQQGKITLEFQKYLFQESPHCRRNRQIYIKILKSNQILRKQLYDNGNVKNKKEYLHAIKVMQLRCKSATLAERAQTR